MDNLIEFIKNYKKSNPSRFKRWTVGIIVVLATVVVIAMFAIQNASKLQQIAGLVRERDLLKETARQAKLDAALAKSKEERLEHIAKAEDALERAQELEAEQKRIETSHEERAAVIESIRSWEDVDRVVKP
jgi:hypothetical protein